MISRAYFRNPMAYAAERCGMNEPAYREWLEHYENPVCHHEYQDGKPCGEPIMRVSQPAEFRARETCELTGEGLQQPASRSRIFFSIGPTFVKL